MASEHSRLSYYAIAGLAGLLGGVGDAFINRWARQLSGLESLAIGFLFCNGALALFLPLVRQGTLASAVVVFQVANTLLALAISQMVFAESLSPQRWAGIAVAILGVILVELG